MTRPRVRPAHYGGAARKYDTLFAWLPQFLYHVEAGPHDRPPRGAAARCGGRALDPARAGRLAAKGEVAGGHGLGGRDRSARRRRLAVWADPPDGSAGSERAP